MLIVERAGLARAPTAVAEAATGPDSVALGIALDGGEPIVLAQQVSPDRDYLWLDQVGSAPLRLTAGQHTLRLTYAGRDPNRSTIIDAFLLSPAVVTQRFVGPDGARLTLRYDTSITVVFIPQMPCAPARRGAGQRFCARGPTDDALVIGLRQNDARQ